MVDNSLGQGSELHRLKPMKDVYDVDLFNRLHKICCPVIKRLSKQVDCKRFNLSEDIISSYFWDKMLYVFNKYYGTCSEEHLKAKILASLSTFKNKLLRSAYTEQAEYNQHLHKLDDLFEDSKELEDDTEYNDSRNYMIELVNNYMKEKLSSDALLVFEAVTTPPPYIKERIKDGQRITNLLLIEFFDLPRNRSSVRYLSELRDDIQYWTERASEELKL